MSRNSSRPFRFLLFKSKFYVLHYKILMPFPILFFITQYSEAPEKNPSNLFNGKKFSSLQNGFCCEIEISCRFFHGRKKTFSSTFFSPYSFETSLCVCVCVSRYAKALIQSFLKRKIWARKTVTWRRAVVTWGKKVLMSHVTK